MHATTQTFDIYSLTDKLYQSSTLTKDEWIFAIDFLKNESEDSDILQHLFSLARNRQSQYYGKKVYIRGLVEISNICKNDCYYCGIRASNAKAERYRLSPEQILSCAEAGYDLGFRTIVMQGGEDGYFTDEIMCHIISEIKKSHEDVAVTLSIGERSFESYKKLYDAGADRYLLRHETASCDHYAKLHPEKMLLSSRMECLYNLKSIGYQTGSGFMVGSPYQTTENIAKDMLFLKKLEPQMVGIGPFIPHIDTPFGDFAKGSGDLTIILIALVRLMLPKALIPATTALGTIDKYGREKGILAGANVIMPNLSPESVRDKYALYNNKLHTGAESAQHLELLREKMNKIGYEISIERGDYAK